MSNIQKNFKMKSRLRGLADGGPNMLQRGAKAVGDFGSGVGQYWSEDNARFEKTNPSFGRRMGRALMPHTGFGSVLGRVHDAAGEGDLRGAAGEAVGAIPAFSALRGAKAGVDAAKAVGKQVVRQAGTEAYKQAGGIPIRPTATGNTSKPEANSWSDVANLAIQGSMPHFMANTPARWRENLDNSEAKAAAESPLRGLTDGGGVFTPEDLARFAEQHAMPQGMMPSGGAPVPDISELEPPEHELQDGGLVVGKGGPTDDLVGPVALSNKEYVLPADTVEIVGRDNLDKLRLETHDFQDPEAKIAATGGLPQPVKGSALRGLADGASPNWRVDRAGNVRPATGNSLVPASPRPVPGTSVGPAISPAPRGAAGTPNWYVSGDGTARPSSGNSVGPARTPPPSAIEGKFERVNPNQPRIGAPQAATPAGGGGGGPSAPAAPSAAPSAAPAKRSLLRRAVTGGVKLGAPVVVMGGTAKTVDDAASGYQEQFNQNMFNPDTKYDGSFGDMATRVAADTGNVVVNALNNIGETATGGYAGKLGRGLSSWWSGDGFLDGWSSQSERDKFYENRRRAAEEPTAPAPADTDTDTVTDAASAAATAPNLAPVEQDSYESARLEQMGVPPEAQNAGVVPDAERRSVLRNTEGNVPGQMTNFGTLGGNGNIYGTATEEGGRINSFSGVGRGTRQAPQPGDPNFMGYGGGAPTTRDGSYMAGVTEWGKGTPAMSGPDNSRRREEAQINKRFARMENVMRSAYGEKHPMLLARRLAAMERDRANQMQALRTSYDNRYDTDSRAAASRYAADSSLRGDQEQAAATAANAQLNALHKALEAQAAEQRALNAQSEKGVADMDRYIDLTFGDDPAEGRKFRAFVDSADPEEIGELTQLYGGDRRRALDEMRERMEQLDIVNDAQTRAYGRKSSLYSPIVHTQNPKFLEDIFNGVSTWESMANKLGELTGAGFGGQVYVLGDGRRVSASRLGDDARTLRSIRDQQALSALRQ